MLTGTGVEAIQRQEEDIIIEGGKTIIPVINSLRCSLCLLHVYDCIANFLIYLSCLHPCS